VLGSTMGSRAELAQLLRFCEYSGVRPVIDRVMPLDRARDGFAALERGDVFGKVVFTAP
jgi:D-arabinose 1-dehydrogenase-like Zn-dependent alcohol dehydrogenase